MDVKIGDDKVVYSRQAKYYRCRGQFVKSEVTEEIIASPMIKSGF